MESKRMKIGMARMAQVFLFLGMVLGVSAAPNYFSVAGGDEMILRCRELVADDG